MKDQESMLDMIWDIRNNQLPSMLSNWKLSATTTSHSSTWSIQLMGMNSSELEKYSTRQTVPAQPTLPSFIPSMQEPLDW